MFVGQKRLNGCTGINNLYRVHTTQEDRFRGYSTDQHSNARMSLHWSV